MKTIKFLSLLLVLLVVLSMPIYADTISAADSASANDMCGHGCGDHEHNEEAEITNVLNESSLSENSFSQSEKKIKTIFGLMTQAEIDAYNANFIAETEAKKEAERLAAEEKLLKARGFTGISLIEVNGVKVMLADYNSANLALIQEASRKAAILRILDSAEQKSSNSCTHPTWMTFWVSDTHPHEYDVMCTNCSEIKLGGMALPNVTQTQITGSSHITGSGHTAVETCTYSTCTYSNPTYAYYTNGECKDCCGYLYGHTFIFGPKYSDEHPHPYGYECSICGAFENQGNTTYIEAEGEGYPGCTNPECTNPECQHTSLGPPTISSSHSSGGHQKSQRCLNSSCNEIIWGYVDCYKDCLQCTEVEHSYGQWGTLRHEVNRHVRIRTCSSCGDEDEEITSSFPCCTCGNHIYDDWIIGNHDENHEKTRQCTECDYLDSAQDSDYLCCACGYHNFTLESECSLYDCGGDGHTVYPKCSECGDLDSFPSPNKHERSDCPSCHVHDYSDCLSDWTFVAIHNSANSYHEARSACKSTGTCACRDTCTHIGSAFDKKKSDCAKCIFSENTETVYLRHGEGYSGTGNSLFKYIQTIEPANAQNNDHEVMQIPSETTNAALQSDFVIPHDEVTIFSIEITEELQQVGGLGIQLQEVESFDESFKLNIIPDDYGYVRIKYHSSNYYLGFNEYVDNEGELKRTLIITNDGTSTNTKWIMTQMDMGYYRFLAYDNPDYALYSNTTGNSVYVDSITENNITEEEISRIDWMVNRVSDGLDSIEWELQKATRWCWIAAAKMASMAIMDSQIEQESAVLFLRGLNGGNWYYPDNGTNIDYYVTIEDKRNLNVDTNDENLMNAFNEGAYCEEIKNALNYIVGADIAYSAFNRVYSQNALVALLDAGSPVIICGYDRSDTGNNEPGVIIGHAYVVVGYSLLTDKNGDGKYDDGNDECLFTVYDPGRVIDEYGANGGIAYVTYRYLRTGQPQFEDDGYSSHNYVWKSSVTFETVVDDVSLHTAHSDFDDGGYLYNNDIYDKTPVEE
ncbi:MAG: hypothetical protein E7665_00990 [Ruminococcaceae bacterium]|nr:hypothetical protein [Oscillospiraceae bacterium]